jgi:hypothetical protein
VYLSKCVSLLTVFGFHPKSSAMKTGPGIRNRSTKTICGLPLFDISLGPDEQAGEARGHARGIIAIGDVATGWLALGGFARGFVALGGAAVGVIAMGGAAVGILGIGGFALGAIALGGLSIGGIAFGGGAIGCVAVGGGAIGYYACGSGALGKYVVSVFENNPEAIDFFKQWIPWVIHR